MAKTADRIITALVDHHPATLTDKEIAAALQLPAPSVRRTRSRLEDSQMVVYSGRRDGASTFTAAPYLLNAQQPN